MHKRYKQQAIKRTVRRILIVPKRYIVFKRNVKTDSPTILKKQIFLRGEKGFGFLFLNS